MSIIVIFWIFAIFSVDFSNSGRKRKGPKKVKVNFDKLNAIEEVNKHRSKVKPNVKNFAPTSFDFRCPPFEQVNMTNARNWSCFCQPVVDSKQFKHRPKFVWNSNQSIYYMLFLTGVRPFYEAYGYYHYHNWIVGNIPGCQVARGQEIMRYRSPYDPKTPDRPIYRVWVYEQPGRITFEEFGKNLSREFTTVDNLTAKYNMTWPYAWNTYYVDDEIGNSTVGIFTVWPKFKLPALNTNYYRTYKNKSQFN